MILLQQSVVFWIFAENIVAVKNAAGFFERTVSDKIKELKRQAKTVREKKTIEKEDLLAEVFQIEAFIYHNIRYSLFLSAYAQFEQALLNICDDFRQRYQIPLALKDISGQGIRRCQTYIKKVVGVPFPDDEPEWARIVNLNILRNHLAHRGPWVSVDGNEDDRIVNILEKEKYLTFDGTGSISFKSNFVKNAADLFEAFVWEIAYRSVEDLKDLSSAKSKRISLQKVKRKLARGVK